MKKIDESVLKEKDKAIEDLKKQLSEAQENWKRALADYQNLEKRHSEDRVNFIKFSIKNFVLELLPVVDALEKTHEYLQDKGLELSLKQLHKILKAQNVEKINVLGKDFDIQMMEAVSVADGKEDNKVITELSPGYTLHGSILRPAKGIVSKNVQNSKS